MRHFWHFIALAALLGAVVSAQDEPKKITRAEALSAVSSKVQPEYPPVARQLRIQGTVELAVLVAETGEVLKVDIVSGNPMFTGPSAQAVKRWKFRPFVENGKPIRVLAPVTVDFKM
jgi:protein TonB